MCSLGTWGRALSQLGRTPFLSLTPASSNPLSVLGEGALWKGPHLVDVISLWAGLLPVICLIIISRKRFPWIHSLPWGLDCFC